MHAANEVAVSAFLEKKISFMAIPRIVRSTLDKDWNHMPSSFEDVFATSIIFSGLLSVLFK